jgi:tetratricopeptide (TPR) repeat protein
MLSKIKLILFVILILGGSLVYFNSNSSYQDSIEARIYYFLGNYKKAYELAKKAYEKDSYNKMANTVLTQSKIAIDYEKYIQQGNEYLKKINDISSKNNFSPADKTRIKMMCEIMIDSFSNLKSSVLTDKILVENAKKMQKKFKQLHAELF